jgi:hypothetical protein
MQFTILKDRLDCILTAPHYDMFHVLDAHAIQVDAAPVISMRAFLPLAEQAWVSVGAGCPV